MSAWMCHGRECRTLQICHSATKYQRVAALSDVCLHSDVRVHADTKNKDRWYWQTRTAYSHPQNDHSVAGLVQLHGRRLSLRAGFTTKADFVQIQHFACGPSISVKPSVYIFIQSLYRVRWLHVLEYHKYTKSCTMSDQFINSAPYLVAKLHCIHKNHRQEYLDTSFGDWYGLLLHGFMNSNLVLGIHLVKLIDAANTLTHSKSITTAWILKYVQTDRMILTEKKGKS